MTPELVAEQTSQNRKRSVAVQLEGKAWSPEWATWWIGPDKLLAWLGEWGNEEQVDVESMLVDMPPRPSSFLRDDARDTATPARDVAHRPPSDRVQMARFCPCLWALSLATTTHRPHAMLRLIIFGLQRILTCHKSDGLICWRVHCHVLPHVIVD